MDFFCFLTCSFFPILLGLVKGRRPQALMDFFCFLTCTFFYHFIGFDLRPSGSGFDGCSLFFDLQLLFPFFCVWFKAVGFRVLMDFFCLSTCSFSPHFIAFGLRPSGSGFDGFFLSFDLQLVFPFYWLWWKAVGFSLWWIFFACRFAAFFFIFFAFHLSMSGIGFDGFFLFFDLELLFPFFPFDLRSSGLGYNRFF